MQYSDPEAHKLASQLLEVLDPSLDIQACEVCGAAIVIFNGEDGLLVCNRIECMKSLIEMENMNALES